MQIVDDNHQQLLGAPFRHIKSRKKFFSAFLLTAALTLSCHSNAEAESTSMAPIQLAQAPPQFIPTDVTPFTINPERNNFNPGYKFKLFQALPERLWFNLSTEISQRLDTNVLFTADRPKADYVFRVLPNVTVGYNIAKNTSVYVNYFVIKDTFATHGFLNAPTTQSLSWGIQHNKRLGDKTTLQYNLQARELWQAQGLHQFDFIPGMTLIHSITPKSVIYASTLLQMRGGQYFVAPTREIDPFYTLGYLHMHGPWTFIATDTLVTNFRHGPFNDSIPKESNVTMIADFEVNRPVVKRFPSLLAFVRAEPIFNWDSHRAPGLSGFDFRLYSGLRFITSKPSYYAQTQNLKKQLMNQENNPKSPNGTTPPNAAGPYKTKI
ncbi:MAG: hypothetical protein P4L53_09705 [Candidatus Obscuribacterales bacterium]|nr:hypothetical protein [Candidatus Obscuribacterales bacterium]